MSLRPAQGFTNACDRTGCSYATEVRAKETDFSIEELLDLGWYVGILADYCPECTKSAGGIGKLIGLSGTGGAPTPLAVTIRKFLDDRDRNGRNGGGQ